MAEEETGFTFVDKRRTALEPASAAAAETPAGVAEPQALQSPADANAWEEPGAD